MRYGILRVFLAGAAACACLFSLAACNAHTERPTPPRAQALYDRGQQLYLEFCAECHQVDGTGWSTLYPRLAGNPIVTLPDAVPIIDTVVNGQGSMMSFTEKITSEDLAAVLTYIRNAWGNHAPAVTQRQIH